MPNIGGANILVPRAFLRHTLITKPNEHRGTLRCNAPRIWVHLEAIMDFTVPRQRKSTESGRCSGANSAEDEWRN